MSTSYRRLSALLIFLIAWAASTASLALEVLTVCDSITQGLQRTASGHIFGVTSPGNGRANYGGYQPRLNQLLDANIEPSTVYNWGIGGERSNQTVGRINNVLNSRPAEYILILCGANDVINGISASTTSSNIKIMVEKSLAKGVTPIVGELTPYTSNNNNTIDFNIWANYNPKIRAVAAAKSVPIAYLYGKDNNYNATSWANDMRKCWKGSCNGFPPYHSGDGLHLSALGYRVMADIWFDSISASSSNNSNVNLAPILLPLNLD